MRSLRRRRVLDIWPGFVDALASLIMVMIFVLLIFTIGQFFLSDALSGRDKALVALNTQLAGLAEQLNMARSDEAKAKTRAEALAASLSNTEQTIRQRDERIFALSVDVESLQKLKAQLESEIARMVGESEIRKNALVEQTELNAKAAAQVELLNRQMAALQEQLGQISKALELSKTEAVKKDARIEDLGKQLNLALVDKVQQLSRYRSEFFGRLHEALGNRTDIKVVGDRFVFPSEVLFPPGSDQIGPDGIQQLDHLATLLKAVSPHIPQDLDWVLQVNGHTDKRPIATARFHSNWELSTARAVAIVNFLQEHGISSQRLAAAGYGEFQPLDPADSETAYARNRRIEIKLTNR
ncbi:MAG: peptidoglycan -binding protein [Methylococcaceae bacterium]|nr:peptidoglycan -binding protein [Methylococcaceae bacterium]